ncbi:hypothetical protein [Caldisericum sp. AR60]|uniref:hypothetical protein n=1 Tax=Caldisericum sp. AR60 TaxID=3397852 RepID=UPI0039FC0046
MPLLSQKEVLNLKLSSIPLKQLKEFARNLGINGIDSATEIIKKVLEKGIKEDKVNKFIKQKYNERIEKRRKVISDDNLKKELKKSQNFFLGCGSRAVRPENTN